MSRNLMVILFVVVVLLALFGYYFGFFMPQKNTDIDERQDQVGVIEELTLDGEELNLYYAAYKDPFVIHVRKALDGYLAGTNVGIDTPEVTIKKSSFDDGTPAGLASFDKRYYESKFVVLSVDDALFGGREIALVFQDKPDRIFTAWVYKYGDEDRYDLRGFSEHKEATRNIKSQLKKFGKYIFDKEHSL